MSTTRDLNRLVIQWDTKPALPRRAAELLRGAIAARNPNCVLLHHHELTGQNIYFYPRVQYKVAGKKLTIVAIDEAIEAVDELTTNLSEITLSKARYILTEVIRQEETVSVGESEIPTRYEFVTPWLALNQKNMQQWGDLSRLQRRHLLQRVLVGNCLSMSKGLGITVTQQLTATVDVSPRKVYLKGVLMIGFLGRFSINFEIPDLLGIGKSVSRGFGTVQQIKNRNVIQAKNLLKTHAASSVTL